MSEGEDPNWRGAWLRRQRKALPAPPDGKWVTQEQMAARLSEAGIYGARTDYNKLENGRRPISDELLAKLAGYFSVAIPKAPAPAVSETDNLAVALAGLTVELEAIRRERLALWQGIQVALAEPGGERVARALSGALASLLPELVPQ